MLNAKSECPARYKSIVISGGIRRAYKICSSHELFENELKRFKQILINNGYTNTEFDQEVVKFLRNRDSRTPVNNNKIKVYYQNQMSASYKLDESIIKNIVRNNTLMVNDNEKLDFVVYYKSPRTKQLIIKNNLVIKAIG